MNKTHTYTETHEMPERVWIEHGEDPVFYLDGPLDDASEYVRIDIHDAEIERLKARIVLWREAYEAVYGAISWGDAYPIKLMDELRPGAEVTT